MSRRSCGFSRSLAFQSRLTFRSSGSLAGPDQQRPGRLSEKQFQRRCRGLRSLPLRHRHSRKRNLCRRAHQRLAEYAAKVSNVNGDIVSSAQIEDFFRIQYDLIFQQNIPIAEVLLTPSEKTLDPEYRGFLPFSGGNVHISFANTSARSTINPNYFMLDWDMMQQVEMAKFIRNIFS